MEKATGKDFDPSFDFMLPLPASLPQRTLQVFQFTDMSSFSGTNPTFCRIRQMYSVAGLVVPLKFMLLFIAYTVNITRGESDWQGFLPKFSISCYLSLPRLLSEPYGVEKATWRYTYWYLNSWALLRCWGGECLHGLGVVSRTQQTSIERLTD